MQQYAIHRLRDSGRAVLVLQYSGLETSGLVVVAPLIEADVLPVIEPLAPIITAGGKDWMLLTYRLAAVPERDIAEKIGQLEDADYILQRAISRLFFGN